MDGTYISKIKTPMGVIDGKLVLKTEGNSISGNIEAMGMKSSFNKGIVNGNTCKFSGIIKSFIGNISYEAIGTINGNEMRVVANTNKGRFEFIGTKQ